MYYKILSADGTSCNGGDAQWSLPHDGQPGEWMPAIEGELVPCERGYHLCGEQDIVQWLGPAIYEAEARGEIVECDDKIVVREARLLRRLPWNERITRLFACDCAERVLPIYEQERPDDLRPRQAIEMARRYADGQATDNELAAAWDAAWDAAGDAAGAAAWAAAGAAARAAAWAAARDAAGDAARAAARAAAWYAAGDAAGDAAGYAARAAARYAAGDAAGDAARAAARAAERQWQMARLMWYLAGGAKGGQHAE